MTAGGPNDPGNPRVTGKGGGHGTGNDLLILLQIRQGSKREPPVGDLSNPSVVSDLVGLDAFGVRNILGPKNECLGAREKNWVSTMHGGAQEKESLN